MSEIASVGSTTAAATPAQTGSYTSGAAVQSSNANVAVSSQQINQSLSYTQINQSSSLVMAEYSTKMNALILALIEILFGQNEDEDNSTAALLGLMMYSESYQYLSISMEYSESSLSMSSSISQQSAVGSFSTEGGGAYTETGAISAGAVGGAINVSA